MDSPSDITAVFRMRKDFDSFIRGQQDDATLRLNLDKNVFTSFSERRKHASEAEAIKAQIGQLYISFKNQIKCYKYTIDTQCFIIVCISQV